MKPSSSSQRQTPAQTFSGLAWDQDDGREVVAAWHLEPVGKRPPLGRYLSKLWDRRHFIWADSHARALSTNHGFLLGNAWLVLGPLLDGFTYYLIFGLLLGVSRGMDNFIGYLLVGVFMFSFSSRSLTSGANALSSGRTMIRGFTFPRAALPISVVLRELIGMGPVLVVMFGMILAIPPHAKLSMLWLLFPLVLVLQTAFNLGLALFMARLATHLPDLRKFLGFFTRLWLYGSGVIWSFDRFVNHPQLLAFLEANPAYIVLDIARDLLLYADVPTIGSWLKLSAWALGTLAAGFLFFWHAEERYGRE